MLRKTDDSDITVSVLDNLELYMGIGPFNILPINWQNEAGTMCRGTITLNEDGSVDLEETEHLYTIEPSSWTWQVTNKY